MRVSVGGGYFAISLGLFRVCGGDCLLPHFEQYHCADQRVLDGAWEEERRCILNERAHYVCPTTLDDYLRSRRTLHHPVRRCVRGARRRVTGVCKKRTARAMPIQK